MSIDGRAVDSRFSSAAGRRDQSEEIPPSLAPSRRKIRRQADAKKRRIARRATVLAGIVLLGVYSWRPALRALGTFLVVDDGVWRVDAVVVLSGDSNRERLDSAIALVRQGSAKGIIVLTGVPPAFYDEEAATRDYAERLGLGAAQVTIARGAHSTADDAVIAAQVMNARGWRSAIVVTSPSHTRRARWMFRRAWDRLGLASAVHPSRDPRFDPAYWWTDASSAEAVVLEYAKFAVYVLWYGLSR